MEITLARIRGVVGSTDAEGMACLGSPQLVDTHKPGSFRLQSFSGDYIEAVSSFQRSVPMIALRIFRPALETSVQLEGEKPHFVWLWHRHRRVLAASGTVVQSGELVERFSLGASGMGRCAEDSGGHWLLPDLSRSNLVNSGLWKEFFD